MAIPKIIHYCWFGENEMPEREKECVSSWKDVAPDYEVVLWNEASFDVNSIAYVKQAYENKKYAFVSDYVRVYALCNFGGIYLDTDVKLLKSLDPFLNNIAFMGFENKTMVGTCVIGATKEFKLFMEILQFYNNNNFIDENGIMDKTTNVKILAKILNRYGFSNLNSEQIVEDLHIYERDVFCPKKIDETTFRLTERTVTIHYFTGSWLSDREKKRGENIIWRKVCRPLLKKMRNIFINILGEPKTKKIEIKIRNILK